MLLIFTCAGGGVVARVVRSAVRCRKRPLTNCFGESAGRCRDHIPMNWSRSRGCGKRRQPPPHTTTSPYLSAASAESRSAAAGAPDPRVRARAGASRPRLPTTGFLCQRKTLRAATTHKRKLYGAVDARIDGKGGTIKGLRGGVLQGYDDVALDFC